MRLVEGGFIQEWSSRLISARQRQSSCYRPQHILIKQQPIDLTHTTASVIITALGIAIATIALIIENIVHRVNKT